MNRELILESVRERDIDLLLLEEWNVKIEFAKWFLEKITGLKSEIEKTEGQHSIVQDNLGETDLFLCYYESNIKSAILLENKIDAFAQDEQGSRYLKRAIILKNTGKYKNVNTCIIAPVHYLERNEEVKYYQYKLSYEDLLDYFSSTINIRMKYKASIITLAIEQERRGYTANPDPMVTQFWHDYWEQIKVVMPNIYMKEPNNIPEGSDWPVLSFDWMPMKWILRHKLISGYIDLEMRLTEEEISKINKRIKGSVFSLIKTGKSYSVRVKVLPINRHKPLMNQYTEFENSVAALKMIDERCELFL